MRHQRSYDAFFDISMPGCKNGIDNKGYEHIYKLIETLLPKSRENPELPKLAELFGKENTARPGWITFFSE